MVVGRAEVDGFGLEVLWTQFAFDTQDAGFRIRCHGHASSLADEVLLESRVESNLPVHTVMVVPSSPSSPQPDAEKSRQFCRSPLYWRLRGGS